MVADTVEFTYPEFGTLPVFDLEDDVIEDALDVREQLLLGSAPRTLQSRILKAVRKGLEAGDTMGQIRGRIARVSKRQLSPNRIRTIARTESANFINYVRHEMFRANGIPKGKWATAGDEHVRHTHVIYGNSKPQLLGFNYMSLSGGTGGVLTFPGDPAAPVQEVVECRCLLLPVEK
jgi:uncharacterized protein with gpF-like domain